jgi:hypothetical protein
MPIEVKVWLGYNVSCDLAPIVLVNGPLEKVTTGLLVEAYV